MKSPRLTPRLLALMQPQPLAPRVVHVFAAGQPGRALSPQAIVRTATSPMRPAQGLKSPQRRPATAAAPGVGYAMLSRSASNVPRPRSVDPRAAPVVAPFRDITRQPTSTSIDGRLLYLLKDYANTVLPAQDAKVQNIASRLRRSKILTQPEMAALETCFQRNANFMATVERILGEAVEKQVDMQRSVIHQSYEIWRACADANSFIGTLLDTAQSAIGAGKYNKSNIQNYGAGGPNTSGVLLAPASRQPSASVMSSSVGATRHASPSPAAGQRHGTPVAFAQIARPNAPSRQQLEPFQSSAANAFMRRTASPASLRPVPQVAPSLSREHASNGMNDFSQNLTMPPQSTGAAYENVDPNAMFMSPTEAAQRAMFAAQQQQQQRYRMPSNERARSGSRPGHSSANPVGVQDAREAQAMFDKLFGPEEGRTRFLHWLSELPQSTIQQLHRSLAMQQ